MANPHNIHPRVNLQSRIRGLRIRGLQRKLQFISNDYQMFFFFIQSVDVINSIVIISRDKLNNTIFPLAISVYLLFS